MYNNVAMPVEAAKTIDALNNFLSSHKELSDIADILKEYLFKVSNAKCSICVGKRCEDRCFLVYLNSVVCNFRVLLGVCEDVPYYAFRNGEKSKELMATFYLNRIHDVVIETIYKDNGEVSSRKIVFGYNNNGVDLDYDITLIR